MAESEDLHALVQVSTEIDESEIKLTFASQCIKAQEELVNKLKKEIQRRREIWNFMKTDNLKLETEIRNAEHEIKNLMISHETIRSANVQAKKEFLMSKENYFEIVERVRDGEKKYEDLWLQCKSRYESLPLVQKSIEATKKSELLKSEIDKLRNEANILDEEVKAKKYKLQQKDREQIIQLAKFIVNDMPNYTRMINEKYAEVNDMVKEIDLILAEQETDKHNASATVKAISKQPAEEINIQIDDDWPKLSKNMCDDDTLMMPRLQLQNVEHDSINDKLDITKVTLQTIPIKRTVSVSELEKNSIKRSKADENLNNDYISCYFNKPSNNDETEQNEADNYSNRKLINILEDIKLDDNETYSIVARINPEKFQGVDIISAAKPIKHDEKHSKNDQIAIDDKVTPLENEEIEEIDLTKTNSHNILIPPTQFLDFTQDNGKQSSQQEVQVIVHMSMEQTPSKDQTLFRSKNSQDSQKKKVSFDLSVEEVTDDNMLIEDSEKPGENETENNETINSQLDLTSVTDDNYMSIQNMILKKHNLDLSPQFVYAKNNLLPKRDDEKIVTSKFFENPNRTCETDNMINNKQSAYSKDETTISNNGKEVVTHLARENPADEHISEMTVVTATSSQKVKGAEKPVSGILFTHGPQGIPECLDISMSTTGYEEGDADFPLCLDSSLLLSPKADLPLPESDNNEMASQEVPNFLSGFRKAGLSFFNQKPSEPNADSSVQNQGSNFNFNFGGEDKKNRGGLFSFFR